MARYEIPFNLDAQCTSTEQAVAELVGLVHSRPPADRYSFPDIHPHSFGRCVPYMTRWAPLLIPSDFVVFNPEADTPLTADVLVDRLCAPCGIKQRWIAGAKENGRCEYITRGDEGLSFCSIETRQYEPLLRQGKVFAVPKPLAVFEAKFGVVCSRGWVAFRDYIALDLAGSGFTGIAKGSDRTRPVPADPMTVRNILWAASMSFSLRYEWQISFGFDQCASAIIIAERDSLPTFVKQRDLPEGKTRRPALVNLVSKHVRRRPRRKDQQADVPPTVFVKEHLRGETCFRHGGLTFEIVPPEFDLERLSVNAEQERRHRMSELLRTATVAQQLKGMLVH